MAQFDPDAISQDDLKELQRAAELSWGEDTRHPSFQEHPDPSAGQCLVTSRWLQQRLGGGFIGMKKGHYFWVSPDKQYIIDLTGDKYSTPPYHPSVESQMDENGEQIRLDPNHRNWMTGPSVFVRASHPEYRDFRIMEDESNPRSELFAKRADAYMRGQMPKEADLMGPTAYPDSTPQKQEDWVNNGPMLHDEAQPNSMSADQQFTFTILNGNLRVDPARDHQELMDLEGLTPDATGPMAFGYGDVIDSKVTWYVSTNMSTNTVHKMLSDFSDNMGWGFEGMLDAQGNPIDDSYGAKKSMWYTLRPDNHLILSSTPLKHGSRITVIGSTAHVPVVVGPARAALQEWAQDFGYKLAEYPGGEYPERVTSSVIISEMDRFWSKVDKTPGYGPWGDCWIWTAAKNNKGYGVFQIGSNRQSKIAKAHRFSYELAHGPTTESVLHKCDNPSCVNPAHLWAGSILDNNQDMWRKGRGTIPHYNGEQNPAAKLSNEQADEIRNRYASEQISQRDLAHEYGVSQRSINKIVNMASYPGGGNMLDKMKVMPNLDQHNLGDQDAVPDVDWSDINQAHGLECSVCGEKFDNINALISHDKERHHPDAEHTPTDNLPWRDDMDDPLGFGTWPYPTGSEGLGGG